MKNNDDHHDNVNGNGTCRLLCREQTWLRFGFCQGKNGDGVRFAIITFDISPPQILQ